MRIHTRTSPVEVVHACWARRCAGCGNNSALITSKRFVNIKMAKVVYTQKESNLLARLCNMNLLIGGLFGS